MTESNPVRRRMIEGAGRLLTRQGYAGTSMRAIVQAAKTPWGSVHHYFPGGKSQVAVEAIELGDRQVRSAIAACLEGAATPADAVRAYFALAGSVLEDTGFEQGCPVATVALETASDDGAVAASCSASFDAWIAAWAEALAAAGVEPGRAREVATVVVGGVEGALLLSRVRRDLEPMRLAAASAGALVEEALAAVG